MASQVCNVLHNDNLCWFNLVSLLKKSKIAENVILSTAKNLAFPDA